MFDDVSHEFYSDALRHGLDTFLTPVLSIVNWVA